MICSNELSVTKNKAAHIIDSQNAFINFVQRAVERLALEVPHVGFKWGKVEREYPFNDKIELAVECSCPINLDIEANRPNGASINGVQCVVGVFQKIRHQSDEQLEDHVFLPIITEQGIVVWRNRNGCDYSPQQLCEFAFERFNAYFDQCCGKGKLFNDAALASR